MKKLIVKFNTDRNKIFTLTFNNPKDGLTADVVQRELDKIILTNVLQPSQGKLISVESAKLVETDTVKII